MCFTVAIACTCTSSWIDQNLVEHDKVYKTTKPLLLQQQSLDIANNRLSGNWPWWVFSNVCIFVFPNGDTARMTICHHRTKAKTHTSLVMPGVRTSSAKRTRQWRRNKGKQLLGLRGFQTLPWILPSFGAGSRFCQLWHHLVTSSDATSQWTAKAAWGSGPPFWGNNRPPEKWCYHVVTRYDVLVHARGGGRSRVNFEWNCQIWMCVRIYMRNWTEQTVSSEIVTWKTSAIIMIQQPLLTCRDIHSFLLYLESNIKNSHVQVFLFHFWTNEWTGVLEPRTQRIFLQLIAFNSKKKHRKSLRHILHKVTVQ